LISKKFEKEIVFESSVLAWIRIRLWIRIRIEQKCWIRIRIKSIRIHNPDLKYDPDRRKINKWFAGEKTWMNMHGFLQIISKIRYERLKTMYEIITFTFYPVALQRLKE
jgi:hypothetical protein